MSCRLIAASWIFVTMNDPRIAALSSPISPLERFTTKILPSSIISRMLKVLFGWPIILRMIGFAVNAPTLLRTGAIASDWNFSFQLANSTFQNCNTTVSVQLANTSLRNFLSVSMRVISSMVVFGWSSSANIV